MLSSIYPNNKHINEKARALEKSGQILRLKKGMYVASKMETGKELSLELIANHIYGPSYVGREYALRYYGLIPERVYLVTSITTKHSRNFENSAGRFSYQNCSPEYFHIGIKMESAWKNRIKGRDWYDFEWYVCNRVPLDFEHLKIRAKEFNGIDLSKEHFLELLKNRLGNADINAVKADVEPYIIDQRELEIWSNDYFLQLADMIVFQ